MKRILYIAAMVIFFMSCRKEKVASSASKKPEVEITFIDLTYNLTLHSDTVYLFHDILSVTNNAVLTIEPGTVLKATNKSALISVQRGARLMAEGTAEHPIVFTTSDSIGLRHHGSWIGLFIYGKAPLTAYSEEIYDLSNEMDIPGLTGSFGTHESNWGGGDDAADNSGVLKYVRIEFAGAAVAGLNLVGVGTGTVLENIEVSYTGGAAFAFWGGTVNVRNLVAFNTGYSGFFYANGYKGRQQFLVSYKHPWFGSSYPAWPYPSTLDGVLVINDIKDYQVGYNTRPIISNLTVIGPYEDPGFDKSKPCNAAVNVSKGSAIALRNSVLAGMPAGGFKLGDDAAALNLLADSIDLSYNLVHSNKEVDAFTVDPNYVYSVDAATVSQYAIDHHNTLFATPDALMLTDPFNYKAPGLLPKQGSPALGGAGFEGSDFDAYFKPVFYVGAFGATDWMKGWTDFYPVTATY